MGERVKAAEEVSPQRPRSAEWPHRPPPSLQHDMQLSCGLLVPVMSPRRKAEIHAEKESIAANEARIKEEENATLKAEEAARDQEEAKTKAVEDDARVKAEEEARIKAEKEEARAKAAEEGRIKEEE